MKIPTTILLLLVSILLHAQDFEGTLTYTVDFEISKKMQKMGVTKEYLKSNMEKEGTWADTIKTSYKNGFYKQLNYSKDKSWIIYRPDSNKTFTFQEGEEADICTVNNAAKDLEYELTGNQPAVTLLDTSIKYLDFNLKMVEVKWKTGSYFYLFDEDYFKTNPENYKGHTFDGFYEFLKISKSLPIIIIKEGGGMMTMTLSLVDFSEHTVEESIFLIPELIEDEELNYFNVGLGKMMRVKK